MLLVGSHIYIDLDLLSEHFLSRPNAGTAIGCSALSCILSFVIYAYSKLIGRQTFIMPLTNKQHGEQGLEDHWYFHIIT